ncbi:MAG: cis-prenyltransferase [Heterodermia speciosa]|uniref:Cis-prenyltransferase n=1 Tax=Heterodermia speciosa TaxID=116794 RepID=A0A8H3IJL4_9LECA|nr:MAG: cis-prenyltransferase [Heterodermia speciosa]
MPSMHLSQTRSWFLQSPPVEWAISQVRELLIGVLSQGPIPKHVAFVMDGNRRFARHHGIETIEGHSIGFEALVRILEVCYKTGVRVVTIYAFSIENFKRSKYEVDALMDMFKVKLAQLSQHSDLLQRYGARIRVLGQRELVKPDVLEAIDRAVELTKDNGDAILNICFSYTSQDEMTSAIRDTVVEYSKPLPSNLPRPFSQSHITHTIRSRHLPPPSSSQPSAALEQPPPRPLSPFLEDPTASSDTEDSLASTSASASASTTLHPSPAPSTTTSIDSPHPSSSDFRAPSVPSSKPFPTYLSSSAASPSSTTPTTYPDPESITAHTLTAHMHTAGMPPLDLLVRTSGVERLSDFMLWQCHERTEITFLKALWPEFDLWNFLPVLVEWQWRRRRREREIGGGEQREGKGE